MIQADHTSSQDFARSAAAIVENVRQPRSKNKASSVVQTLRRAVSARSVAFRDFTARAILVGQKPRRD
jgi:hypothetical protein